MPPSPKAVAVVLSGCGYQDGSEITEAVSTLIALTEAGAHITCFAPIAKIDDANRIARGTTRDLTQLHEADFDAVVFPGGFGAAKTLSNWADLGVKSKVDPEVKRIISEFHAAAKPIGAMCIAPTLIAKVLGKEGVNLTIGNDAATAAEIEKTGARHVKCAVTDYVSDRDHKVLTTPAYMLEASPIEVFTGIRQMLGELIEMA